MIRLAVAGAAGRMGKTILTLALKDQDFQITAALEQRESPMAGKDLGPLVGAQDLKIRISTDPVIALKGADVLVDFTHPSAIPGHLKALCQTKTGYVLGTTGIDEKTLGLVQKASKEIPVVQSPNMSVGVNLLFRLAELTAKALDESYDIEIAEIHHRMKKDSPSGTALKLLEILSNARNKNLKTNSIYGREGAMGARPKGQIGVFALRGGDVVGEHTVSFFGDGERVELVHKASSRDAFALGALRAAKFVAARKSGLYNMAEVLGIA